MNDLIFAACDRSYFEAFGSSFLKSAAFHGHKVHIHVMNSGGTVERIHHPLISYSFEENAPDTREYYASRRFFMAEEFILDSKRSSRFFINS